MNWMGMMIERRRRNAKTVGRSAVCAAKDLLEQHGYLAVPCRAGVVTGHAPLHIDHDDIAANGFAIYVEGLTSQEASDLLKAAGRMPGTANVT